MAVAPAEAPPLRGGTLPPVSPAFLRQGDPTSPAFSSDVSSPTHPSARRASFSSGDSRMVRSKSKGSSLPSIRSLKSKFLGALGGGLGGGGGGERRGPRIVKGDGARKPIRIVSAGAMGGGLKGFGGPAGMPSSDLPRSVSTPVGLHHLSSPPSNGLRPMLGTEEEFSPSIPASFSVDAMLSHVAEAARSPAMPSKDLPYGRSSGRAVSAPYDASALSPYAPQRLSSPAPPRLELPSPSSHPYDLPLPIPYTPVSPSRSSIPVPVPPPPPQQKDPIIRPVSLDFSRRPSAVPLAALREQQQRDSLEAVRSASRNSGHRHSRILPGASLPSNLVSNELVRSKSLGAHLSEEKRGRHWSAQPLPSAGLHPGGTDLARSTWQGGASTSPPPAWAHRQSHAGDQTPSSKGTESPELEEGEKEAHRGRSLSQLLGQARNGLGLGNSGGASGESSKDRDGRERRPSKPFPVGFAEVPYRPSINGSALASAVSPTNTSPAAFARPLSLPAIVQGSGRRLSQHLHEMPSFASFTDPPLPPSCSKLSHRQSESDLPARQGSVTQSFQPSASTATEPVPPLPQRELHHQSSVDSHSSSSFYSSQAPRTSSLPASSSTSTLSVSNGQSALNLPPFPPTSDLSSSAASSQNHAFLDNGDAAGARGSVQSPYPRRRSDTQEEKDEKRRQVLSMPEGKTFAQVIEERSKGGRPLDSPLGELIEELRSRSNSAQNSPVAASPRPRSLAAPSAGQASKHEEGADSDEDDDDEVEEPSSPSFGRKDSEGGHHPFMLSAYLDSPASSPSLSRHQFVHPAPPPPLPVRSDLAVTRPPPSSSPLPSFALQPSPHRTPNSSPPLPHSKGVLASPGEDEVDRTLTLEQMEQEIARMEAELALSGRPHSFYDDSTPRPADVSAFPAVDSPAASRAQTPSAVSRAQTPSSIPPSSSPVPEDRGLQLSSSTSDSDADDSPSPLPDPSSLSQITPRTARRWSILEIEKAYDRMRKMLGSSTSSIGFGLGVGETVGKAEDVSEASEAEGKKEDSLELSTSAREGGDEDSEVEFESALEEALEQARGFTGRQEGDSSSEYASPSDVDKPLPTIPAPTPSPNADRLAASASTAESSGLQEELENGSTTPPSSIPDTSSPIPLKNPADSLLQAPPRHTFDSAAHLRRLAPSPSVDSLRLASSSGHKGKGSDASSTSGIRKLVLPASNQTRLRGKDSRLSMRSAVEDSTSGEEEGEASGKQREAARASTPLSPVRRSAQLAAQRASSRLSSGGTLRSGVGRALQSRASGVEDGAEEDQLFTSPSSATPTRRDRSGDRLTLPPRSLPTSASLDSLRDPRRRSAGARPFALSGGGGGGGDATSWFPVTPQRLDSAQRMRTDSLSTLGSVLGGGGSEYGRRRRSSADDGGDEESLTSGGLEESELMANASLNMASIRGMDKLEIFFKYTAVRADLEKAELERDALLDALRETRSTLGDVRRQRDMLDAELKRDRMLNRQLKNTLGGDPDHYADKIENLIESRQTWELRAREALEELERTKDELEFTRRDMVEGKEREELLERENLAMGARLTAAEMEKDDVYAGSPTLSYTPLPSGLPLPVDRSTPTPRQPRGSVDSTSSFDRSESPTLAFPVKSTSPTLSPPLDPSTTPPSSTFKRRWNAPLGTRDRHASKESIASSASGIKTNGLGDLGSPLMGQTMTFGAKSSYGSTAASPLRSRSAATVTSLLPEPPARSHPGQFSSLRNGTTPSPSGLQHRLSKLSTASSEDSEYGDESFDSSTSAREGRLLRQKDDAFLADLTEVIPASLSSNAGRSSSAEE